MNWHLLEYIGIFYALLCFALFALVLGSALITDLVWRWKRRKRGKALWIREWRLP